MEKKYTYKIFRSFATLIVALLSFYGQAMADVSYSWDGSVLTINANGGGIVNCSGVTENTDVIIKNSWGGVSVDLTCLSTCKSLTLNCQASVTVGNVAITNNLNILDGTLTCGTGKSLTVGGAVILSGGTLSAPINVTGDFTMNGGSYSGTSLIVAGNMTVNVQDANLSSVSATVTGGITLGAAARVQLGTLTLAGNGTHAITGSNVDWGHAKIQTLRYCSNITTPYTTSGYIDITTPTPIACGPAVTVVAPNATCKNSTFSSVTFPSAPAVTSSEPISSQGWEYSETGSSPWTATTSGLTMDKTYYLRYAATDNQSRTGYSNTVQISFLAEPTITISDPTVICAGSTFANLNLTVTSEDNHGCAFTDAGKWQYSENNSSWTDLENTSKVMDKEYYIRYVHSNANGQGRSNSVQVAFKAKPLVQSISAPATYCKGTSLSMTDPGYTLSGCGGTITKTWQYSTDGGITYNNVSDLSTLQTNGTKLRYAVTDINGTGYSNAVTLQVADKPAISISQPAEICGGAKLTFTAPIVTDNYYTTFTDQSWQISANNITYSSLTTNAGYTETTAAMSASQNNYYVRFTATNTCGIGYSEAKQITVNLPRIDLSGIDDIVYGIAGVSATLATATATRVCTNESEAITYSITDASGKFHVDASGAISVDATATAGNYTLTVTATTKDQGGSTVVKEKTFTVTLKNDPTLSMVCPSGPISGNICHPLAEIAYSVTSANIVGNVSVALSGTAADFFTAPTSLAEGNEITLILSQKADKTVTAGNYTVTVTVSAKGANGSTLTHTCDLAITMTNVDTSIPVTLKTAGGATSASIYCSEELGLVATVDPSVEVSRYIWYNGTTLDGKTSNNLHTTSFDCTGSDYDVNVSVQAMSKLGCINTATLPVHIKKLAKTYYYCGPVGTNSNITLASNWCATEGGTAGSCVDGPVDFTSAGCEYIINKDDVELKVGETWNVSGIGSKITLGDGKWTSLSAPSYTSSLGGTLTTQQNYGGQPYGWSVFESSYNPANDEINLYTAVSNMDYRTQAKTFKVSGTMNLSNGVDIDVRCGSELNINTSTGNPDIGVCEQKWSYFGAYEPTHTNIYNQCIIPGSIVTYSGAGATKVQAETYSNVFINTTGTVVWEDGNTEIFGQLKLDNTPSSTDLGGTTLYYDGAVNQSIAPIAYDNLQLQNATTKTLTGNTTVNGQLTIGSGATFDAGDNSYTLNLTDCDNPSSVVVYSGNFDAGNSTVLYSGICNQTIAPMNYYNLSMTNGNKTLSNENVIGVAGSFTPDGSYTYTVDGSTVEFNGTSAQSISAFTFDKLVVNNKSFPSGGAVTMNGNVTVKKQLLMTDGVLTTGTNTLLVTNSASSAVMNGHYTDNTHQSFINGSLTRYLPIGETGTEYTQQYIFPVGNMTNGYISLTLSQLTTETSSGQPIVTVTGVSGSKSGLNAGTGVTKLNPDYYWSVDGNTAYTSARVSLATPANATLASLDYNSVLYSNGSSDYQPINGTALNSSVIRSNAYPDGYYTFGKIAITPKVYYYNCSTHGDITNISNWWTGEGGSGVNATAFNEDYATWIIKCDATITKDLSILGSNVEVIVESDATLTIASNVVFASLHLKKASEVINNNKLTIMEKFTIDPTGVPVGTDRSSAIAILRNNGEMNIYAEKFYIADSWVYNNADATMNFNNTEITIYDPNTNDGNDYAHGGLAGHFINAGDVKMINSGLTVYGRFAQLKNINGATWQVDNTSSAFKRTVLFQAVELYHANNDYVSLECGSTFQVKNSDVRVEFVGNVTGGDANPVNIGGDLIVEDGNLSFHRYSNQGGGTITVEQECGGVFLYDTDNSGDGILTVYSNNSSTQFNIEGTLYTMGFVQEGGSGATMNIKDGGFAFIGDMGATLSGYSWNYKININSGGILHYCGNRTAAADNIGINQGELYYAENFYLSDDPVNQGDFSNLSPATYEALYETLEACMAAYTGTSAELLPIELTMLYGICVDETIELHWQTMSETNSDYFAILRSFDGVTFEEVQTMSASGTTTEMHNYSYDDKVDYSGIVYYKLRQYDFDGKYTDSKIIAVQTCGKNAQFLFKENEIEVTFKNPAVRNHVIITTVTGVIVYSKVFDSIEAARVAMPQAHGVYIISVIDNKQITSEKFINK